MKIKPFLIPAILCIASLLQAQDCSQLHWRTGERLTENDFCLKIEGNENSPSFAQYNLSYKPPTFGLFSNNFNKNVTNIMIREASWIDVSLKSKKETIRYQQILFDLAEIYSRKFRKELLVEKKKIALGTLNIEELNTKFMKEFSEKRAEFEIEYADGNNQFIKIKWENWIKNELDKLSQFDFDNDQKIKLN